MSVVNSGTATLEAALLRTPQVVVYHVFGGPFATLLKKILIKIPFVSLPNLVAGRLIIPELLAHHFNARDLSVELHKLLDSNAFYDKQLTDYQDVITTLGSPGNANRAACMMYEHLTKSDLHVHRFTS